MFAQVITGTVKDPELLLRQTQRWVAEIKPGVKGYLGSTGGVTPDGRGVWVARFESAEAAQANSGNAQQSAWWNETAKAYDGEPTFNDCTEVDSMLGGGSNDAGFVQVIQGKAKDPAAMRSRTSQMEADLSKERPDILGMSIAWHGDGGGFTQVVYFRSEAETRENEKATEGAEMRDEYMKMFDGPPTFYDLPDPQFD
jgi:hypothetical protein